MRTSALLHEGHECLLKCESHTVLRIDENVGNANADNINAASSTIEVITLRHRLVYPFVVGQRDIEV